MLQSSNRSSRTSHRAASGFRTKGIVGFRPKGILFSFLFYWIIDWRSTEGILSRWLYSYVVDRFSSCSSLDWLRSYRCVRTLTRTRQSVPSSGQRSSVLDAFLEDRSAGLKLNRGGKSSSRFVLSVIGTMTAAITTAAAIPTRIGLP